MKRLDAIAVYCVVTMAISGAFAQPTTSPMSDEDRHYAEYKSFKAIRDAAVDVLNRNDQWGRTVKAYVATNDTSGYMIAAKYAWLMDRPAMAIGLLEEVSTKHGSEPEPAALGTGATLDVVCNSWIASIARQSGDVHRARTACATLLTKLKDDPGSAARFRMILLYRAELEFSVCDDVESATASLREAAQKKLPDDASYREVNEMFQNWATFEELKIQGKQNDADAAMKPTRFKRENIGLLGIDQLTFMGIFAEPRTGMYDDPGKVLASKDIALVMEGNSEIDRTLVRLTLASDYQHRKDYMAAGKLYAAVFQDHTFFSPEAGLMMAACQSLAGQAADVEATLKKVEERFPAYNEECKRVGNELKTTNP